MKFVHRPYDPQETIAAVATAPGEGGIAVIRISGKNALLIADQIFSAKASNYQSHTAHFGKILDASKKIVDEVLLLPMHGPKSYTGEDTIEIHCHGGALITRRVLERVLEAGARPAQPGEFTFRAFINGKLDLSQAEAVQELIAAKSELHLDAAEKQLQGALSKKITQFQKELTDSAAILEAWVDFPEEGLEFASLEEIVDSLESTCNKMDMLHATFYEGKILHHGLSLCLSGAPNVGKSSLMNALLGKERAIVTHIAGTTRDLLEADMRLGNLHFKLIDTAGIRTTDELIEAEGIRRSKTAIEEADLILFVMDASKPPSTEEKHLLATLPEDKTILVWNKIDLAQPPSMLSYPHSAHISAKNGIGIHTLHTAIENLIWKKGPPSKEEIVITNERHYQSLGNAITSLKALISGLKTEISPEFLASDMRQTLIELGTIIGTNITEDILTAIFSKFCIGK
jgi:tRNA modification GTPase